MKINERQIKQVNEAKEKADEQLALAERAWIENTELKKRILRLEERIAELMQRSN